MRRTAVSILALWLAACGDDPLPPADAGDAGPSVTDTGPIIDSGPDNFDDATAPDADPPETGADGGEDGGAEDASCTPESDQELCTAGGAECGALAVTDRCGTARNPACGTCPAPLMCGVRKAANRCALEHWDVTTIDASGDVGREVSMVLGPDGYPRVAYQETTAAGSTLKFAAFDGRVWTTETIDNGVLAGSHTAIAYDRFNNLHVAGTSFEGLIVWTSSAGLWQRDLVTATSRGRVDLAYDFFGAAHLCVHNESVANLEHWYQDGMGGWAVDAIEGSTGANARQGDYCSIAIASDGGMWISYEDLQFFRLKYAFNGGAGWVTGVADAPAGDMAGSYTSIAIDGTDTPGISYRAGAIGFQEIRFARYNTPDWDIATVDPNAGAIANHTSLAFDGADFGHISYYDSDTGLLRYARDTVAGWRLDAIEDLGTGTGGFSALALDPTDSAHIVFYNARTQSLRYARYVR